MIFLDTGAIYSLVVSSESRHQDVQRWYGDNKEPLITTDYCVDELLTLFIARKRSTLALPTGRTIYSGELCQLHFVTPDQNHRAWIMFQSKYRLGWSFTDCTSKVVIDDLHIHTAAALDDHFRQFGLTSVVP